MQKKKKREKRFIVKKLQLMAHVMKGNKHSANGCKWMQMDCDIIRLVKLRKMR